jgi:hypothetical protein
MFNLNPKHTERLFACSDNSLDEYDVESDYQEPTEQEERMAYLTQRILGI